MVNPINRRTVLAAGIGTAASGAALFPAIAANLGGAAPSQMLTRFLLARDAWDKAQTALHDSYNEWVASQRMAGLPTYAAALDWAVAGNVRANALLDLMKSDTNAAFHSLEAVFDAREKEYVAAWHAIRARQVRCIGDVAELVIVARLECAHDEEDADVAAVFDAIATLNKGGASV